MAHVSEASQPPQRCSLFVRFFFEKKKFIDFKKLH